MAYGAHDWVAITTADGAVRHCLRGHKAKVHCVAWLIPSRFLVSGAADGQVRVWSINEDGSSWTCSQVLYPDTEEGEACVNRLAVLDGELIAAATTLSVTLWHCSIKSGPGGRWTQVFSTAMPPAQIPCAVALAPLVRRRGDAPHAELALLIGGVDGKIHVWNGTGLRRGQEGCEEEGQESAGSWSWRSAGALTGHQAWVRCLAWRSLREEGEGEGEGVMVASGSQDGKIRLWRVGAMEGAEGIRPGRGEEEAEEAGEGEGRLRVEEEEDDHEVRLVMEGAGCRYGIRLDALLVGHEDWITGLAWRPHGYPDVGKKRQSLALLSCSMDRSLIIWRPEGARGAWTPRVRLGDLGADLGGAVGGNLLGFLGCVFSETGDRVLAHGFGGSFHAYECDRRAEGGGGAEEEEEGEERESRWVPMPFATGHFEEVSDVQWERPGGGVGGGRYLVSVSKDQTTRLWAVASQTRRLHEMSRVQVHGYDLSCCDMLPPRRQGPGDEEVWQEHRLVSGADEKTLRVFDAPRKVLGLLAALAGIQSAQPARIETAYIPALALSSKAVGVTASSSSTVAHVQGVEAGAGREEAWKAGSAVGGGGLGKEDAEAEAKARARVSWEGRGANPSLLEGELVDHTLWPEVAKLYGHGDGIMCLAADPTGQIVASACKARDAETAQVRLWDTGSWRGVGVLPGHASTVVQLAFSHDGSLLASVSKDRQVCLYAREEDGEGPRAGAFRPVQTLARAHKRIIWSCDWAHDDALLATASRDGVVKIWGRQGEGGVMWRDQVLPVLGPEALASFKPSTSETDAVTAVAFAPRLVQGADVAGYLLALGTESGNVELWTGTKDKGKSWRCLLAFDGSLPHAGAVRRLRWKPLSSAQDGDEKTSLILASCGTDHAVKIARIRHL